MKHNLKITLILTALFIASQVVGLLVTYNYLPETKQFPFGIQRPQVQPQQTFIEIAVAIAITTILALLVVKFRGVRLWKAWFLFSVFFTLTISFGAFINSVLAIILAAILSVLKTFKRSYIINNLTELFIYGAIAALFVPILDMFYVTLLLLLISVYDAIAVWKTRHMVSLAKFQTRSRLFAGLHIKYAKNKEAILGGGDIAFPLLFAGVVLKVAGVLSASIVVATTTLSLVLLFMLGKKNTFYPAMSFLSIGCLAGALISILVI